VDNAIFHAYLEVIDTSGDVVAPVTQRADEWFSDLIVDFTVTYNISIGTQDCIIVTFSDGKFIAVSHFGRGRKHPTKQSFVPSL
jgi:hypothetical protein